MAALAYVPALMSSPGTMPADTKLYLYLDPRRLVSDSIWSFDARQFAGWVPHQVIAYLWPSGPWYVAAQAIGLPDWVAHRLWIGTIMFAAGTGIAWAVRRRLGFGLAAAVTAGLVYQLSPYLVPYVSRTSSMLLPWAGLGWVLGLTIGAATRTRWRDAALCALVIATTGSVNATALAMVAPAPLLWLLLAVVERTVTVRRALVAATRIGVLAIGTSLWWLVMLSIQGRQGADLLAYSESLEDVSLTSTATEVWRGLGYWLTYVRDPFAPTTTAGADYMTATGGNVLAHPVALGFVLVLVGLVGLVFTRFAARRFAVALTFVGVVLSVGVHPFDHPSPLAHLLAGDGESGVALALRSSTRALPLLTIGIGLGAAAIVDAVGHRRPRWGLLAAGLVVLLALGNLPSLLGHRLVDPALARDEQPPPAWDDAAAALDAMPAGYRVLQLPGAEFGAYRWGYTVDPPLPGLTTRPLVTRDLLPLGSAAAMDLLYALDDRFQEGWPETESIAPIARLLGADTVWVAGDMAFDRFRTPRPEATSALYAAAAADPTSGLGDPVAYGDPVVNRPQVPMVDEQALSDPTVLTPVAPVELVPVRDPVPVVRAADDETLVSGSGDGLVDLAASGLITGDEVIRYSASLQGDDLLDAIDTAGTLVVTDSNRLRAHHWRSSQDVTGYTETGDEPATLWPDSGDARLDVFPGASLDTRTVSVQDGPLHAVATSYGEPFAYRPEARPAMAVDGDPNTAWGVLDPRGQYLEITTDRAVDHVTLLQPGDGLTGRHLASVRIQVDDREPFDVALDERSLLAGQLVSFPATDGPATVRISLGDTAGGTPGYVDRTLVGFAEADFGIGMSPEVIRTPTDMTTAMRDGGVDAPVTYALTRERVRPTNRWRDDPEARIVRDIDVPAAQSVDTDASVRVDARAADATLAALLGIDGPRASVRLTGVPTAAGWAAADGDESTAWITPFGHVDGAVLQAELVDPDAPMSVAQRAGDYSRVTALRLTQGAASADVVLGAPDAEGRSSFTLPDGFEAGPVRIEITASAPATTRDRRYGDIVQLPAAITEIGNVARTHVPTTFDTGCRDDLVQIDGVAIPVRVRGSVADALAGAAFDAERCDDAPQRLDEGTHRVTTDTESRTGLQVDRVVLTPDVVEPAPARAGGRTDRHRDVERPLAPHGAGRRLPRRLLAGARRGLPRVVVGADRRRLARTPAARRRRIQRLVDPAEQHRHHRAHRVDRTGSPRRRPRRQPGGGGDGGGARGRRPPSDAAVPADRSRRRGCSSGPPTDWPAVRSPRRRGWSGRRCSSRRATPCGACSAGSCSWRRVRVRVAGVVAIVALGYIAYEVVDTVRTEHPDPTPLFPGRFEQLHHLGLFAAVSLAVTLAARARRRPAR